MSVPRGHAVWVCQDCGACAASRVDYGESAWPPYEMVVYGPADALRLTCRPCYEKWNAADLQANPNRGPGIA